MRRPAHHGEVRLHHVPRRPVVAEDPADEEVAAREDVALAARVLARYSQGRDEAEVEVSVHHPDGVVELLNVTPLGPAELPAAWHV